MISKDFSLKEKESNIISNGIVDHFVSAPLTFKIALPWSDIKILRFVSSALWNLSYDDFIIIVR